MFKPLAIILCGGLLWASAAFAVSRVGGGSLSNTHEGLLSLSIPAFFQQDDVVLADDSVRLPGPPLFGGSTTGFPVQQVINIYPLRLEFPVLAAVDQRIQFGQYFLSLGWSKVATKDPCLEIYSLITTKGINVLVGWGSGQGLLLSGPNTEGVSEGIESAVGSITLVPGACAWK